jgi:hypothetical protein
MGGGSSKTLLTTDPVTPKALSQTVVEIFDGTKEEEAINPYISSPRSKEARNDGHAPCLTEHQIKSLHEFVFTKNKKRIQIEFDEGWSYLDAMGISMLCRMLDFGLDKILGKPFPNRVYADLVSISYNMCNQVINVVCLLFRTLMSFRL